MWPAMPVFELVQQMMFVNTCVKFRDNQLRNEVCRAVTLSGGQKPLLGGGGGRVTVACDAYVGTHTRDDVGEHVC